MRENVLDWSCGTVKEATSAIILTHNIDFLFLQSILLPRLRKIGLPKLTIFADAACAANSYQQQHRLLGAVGRMCRIVPVDMGGVRRFHPKAFLLSSPNKASLAVGSGNLTHGGYSANLEIWSRYEAGGESDGAFSAFRNYLEVVTSLAGNEAVLIEEVENAFDPVSKVWARDLPDPDGLIGAPNDQSILDRLVEQVGDSVRDIRVCAPYFDDEGGALTEIAGRWQVPVHVLLQKDAVGLSASAAEAQPDSIEFSSVATDPRRFIHAKVLAFRNPKDVTLVCGSANISRAALLSNGTWGNAELVSVRRFPKEAVEELLSELVLQPDPPVFPETPPSDEWEYSNAKVRLLRASYLDGLLRLRFRTEALPERLSVVTTKDGAERELANWRSGAEATIQFTSCPDTILLRGKFGEETIDSCPLWVSDEVILAKPVLERRIAAKMSEHMEGGSLSANGMLEILGLLNEHIRTPARGGAGGGRPQKPDNDDLIKPYDVNDVFSDGFGRSNDLRDAWIPLEFSQADFLRTFTSYFSANWGNENGDEPPADTGRDDEPLDSDDETNASKIERQRREATAKRKEEGVRLRGRLITAMSQVVAAFGNDEFIVDRTLERLRADIAATALLLRKGLVDQIIAQDDFEDITLKLWRVLFFGKASVIERLVLSRQADAELPPITDLASPKLTAVLAMWGASNLEKDDPGNRFTFSAMLLAGRFPWLVSAGSPEEINSELKRLAKIMPSGIAPQQYFEAWLTWCRAGAAFGEFEQAANKISPRELAALVARDRVIQGELLWQAKSFFISCASCRRAADLNAQVQPLDGGELQKVRGNWLVPIEALLQSANPLGLNENAMRFFAAKIKEL